MNIVVIGGNDGMVTRYKEVCRSYNCKAKVFTQMPTDFCSKIGMPDLMVVFTGTCSHKMLKSVNMRSQKHDIPVEHIRSSSISALRNVLDRYSPKAALEA